MDLSAVTKPVGVRWMAAYSSGLVARNARKQVKDFSSNTRLPERLARQFDS